MSIPTIVYQMVSCIYLQDAPEISICGYSGRKFIQKKFYIEAEHGPSITYEEYLAEMERVKS